MTRDELRQIAANDDDPQSSDLRRGTSGESLFRHWSNPSQQPQTSTSNAVLSEGGSSGENAD